MVHSARLYRPGNRGPADLCGRRRLCFLIDGFSYLAVLGSLADASRRSSRQSKRPRSTPGDAFREGVRYGFGFAPIRALLLMVSVTSLMSMSQSVLMPIFANQILDGNERTLGLLLGRSGFGALAGSLYLASRRSVLGLGRVIAIVRLGSGTGSFAFSASRCLALVAAARTDRRAFVVQLARLNTLLQTLVEDDKRGRVMSLYTMAFMGMVAVRQPVGGRGGQRLRGAVVVGHRRCGLSGGLHFVRVGLAGTAVTRAPDPREKRNPARSGQSIQAAAEIAST